jgi:hypothetical protein
MGAPESYITACLRTLYFRWPMNPISPGPPEPYMTTCPLNPIHISRAPEPYITTCSLNPISPGAPEPYITAWPLNPISSWPPEPYISWDPYFYLLPLSPLIHQFFLPFSPYASPPIPHARSLRLPFTKYIDPQPLDPQAPSLSIPNFLDGLLFSFFAWAPKGRISIVATCWGGGGVLLHTYKIQSESTLKGLSHQIFKAFYDLQYQICTFCVGADGF